MSVAFNKNQSFHGVIGMIIERKCGFAQCDDLFPIPFLTRQLSLTKIITPIMRRFASIKLTWQLRLAVKQNHTLIRITGNIPKRGRQKAICCFNFRVYHAETTWGIIIKNKNVGGVSIESRANIIQLMRLG